MARIPKYKTAETEMLRRIETGEWEVGRRLGNEFELAAEFGVSQGTMRRALMTLEAQGYLERKPGRGTHVADRDAVAEAPATAPAAPSGFDRLSCADDLVVFRAKTGRRPPETVEEGALGHHLTVLERTLKRGDSRAALEILLLPEGPADEDGSPDLSAFLTDRGTPPARIEDRVAARMCTMGESVALSVDRNTALLCLTRTAHDAEGRMLAIQRLRIADPAAYYSVGLSA